MEFRTQIEITPSPHQIDYQQPILLLGSCFAQNMGERMQAAKLPIKINPFGILYNPLSVGGALYRLMHPTPFGTSDLFLHNGRWHSYAHHSLFSHSDSAVALQLMNQQLVDASQKLQKASWLMITWGTAYTYFLKESGEVVANCHKMPEVQFQRRRLSVNEVVAYWCELIDELLRYNPQLQILFTVSPIRHLRDGAHHSQLSKSVLLLAIDQLCTLYPNTTHYFPSYEIVLDELRDYRFYASDMIHPSPVAVDYLWQRLKEAYFNEKTILIMREWEKLNKFLNHRLLDESRDVYKDFVIQKMIKLESFQKKYPYISLTQELETLKTEIQER